MSNTGFFNTGLNVFYLFPDAATVGFVRSVVVDVGVEFTYRPDGVDLFTIDIGENSIDIVFLEAMDWDAAAFNGVQIADQSENLISIVSVSDAGSTVGGFNFQFDADDVFVNWQGSSYQAGDEIHLTVNFGVATPPVASNGTASTNEDTPVDSAVPPATDGGPVHYVLDSTVEFGELTFNSDGTYTFDPDGAFEYLAAGADTTVSFDYHAIDQDGAQSEIVTVTITVTGVNDAPVLAPDDVRFTASVAQTAGEQVATFLSGVTDADTGALAGVAITATGGAGGWEYSLNGTDWFLFTASTGQALLLSSSDYLRFLPTDPLALDTASITYHAWDETGSAVAGNTVDLTTETTGGASPYSAGTAVAAITLNSPNNEPTIGGVSTGTVTEDAGVVGGNLVSGGTLTITDPDPGEDSFIPQASAGANYGVFTLASDGTWTYTVDNSLAALQALGATGTLNDSFTAVSFDGSLSKIVKVTIQGANDVPTVGGTTSGDVTEDVAVNGSGQITTSGALTIADPDTGQSIFAPQASFTGLYGTFTLNAAGTWSYAVNNGLVIVQGLGASGTLNDSFTAWSSDGSANQVVTVAIHGSNDVATIGGAISGDVTEDTSVNGGGNLTAGGTLTVSDPDIGQGNFAAQASFSGTYGTFTLSAAGAWTYTVSNGLGALQALGAGGSLTDSFVAASSDGTDTQQVTVTIHGANDVANIGGTISGDATEDVAIDGSGNLTAGGTLTISDADTGEASFTPQASVSGTYGTFTLDAAGGWTYTVGNTLAAVQALGASATLADSFVAASSDGSDTQQVTVTIHGTNDAATIGGAASGDVTEDTAVDGGGNLTAGGTLTVSDPDAGESTFTPQASVSGTYGTFSLNTAGNWTYAVSNGLAAVQGLAAGATVSDSFVAASSDASDSQQVTVTIHGVNDAASIGGTTSGDVTEDTSVNGGGNLTAGGTLGISDADTGEATFTPQASVSGTYGAFTLDAAGVWTYTVGNSLAAVQALGAGGTLTDAFFAASSDGTDSQEVTVSIHGANDAASIGGTIAGDVTEDTSVDGGGNLTAAGSLTVSDPDTGQSTFTPQASFNGTYGTFTLNAAGDWTYTVSNGLAAVQALGAGATVTDTLTAASSDGSDSQAVTVTLHGVNDAPAAVADTGSAGSGETKSFNVVANDGDVDAGDTRTLSTLGAISVTSTDADIDGIDAIAAFSIVGNQISFVPGLLFGLLDDTLTASVVVNYTMKDSQDVTSSSTLTLTVGGVNHAPAITSNGGGASAAVGIAENQTAVATVAALDTDASDIPQFAIVGGADAFFFAIDADTGALAFKAAPNFEKANDANHNNVYSVVVQVSDGDLADTQAIDVTVTNVGGVVVKGTMKNDTISAWKSVAGKPKPTGEEDFLVGARGNDLIYGMGGNDTLNGGFGKNKLVGGEGHDLFVFNTKLGLGIQGSPASGFTYSKIGDFSVVDDTIGLSKAIFKPLKVGVLKGAAFWKGPASHDGSDRIIYNPKNGALSFDPDGWGVQHSVQFATLQAKLGLTAADFLIF